ncbi:MAG: response regulator [Myxococcaceae bacterium]|nr:response regulator [Myxococcaceae bacterium]
MKKTLLLVDDDVTQLKLTRAILVDAGFEVRTAKGGRDALEQARAEPPDLVVSDVLMSDCDGFRLCQELRADAGLKELPVVLVSAHFQAERDRALAAAVGANGYAERSPDFSRELAAVQAALVASKGGPPRAERRETEALYAERVSEQLSTLLDQARAADLRYQVLFERANDALAVLDAQGTVVELNRRMEEVLGRPRAEVVGAHYSSFGVPSEAAQNDETFRDSLTGAKKRVVTGVLRPDGTRLAVEFSTSTIEVSGARQVLAIGRDVTAELATRAELHASEAKYRSLVENLVDVIFVSNAETGEVELMTPNVSALTGFTADEVLQGGRELWASRVHPDDLAQVEAAGARVRAGEPLDIEVRVRHRDGALRWLRVRGHITMRDGARCVEGQLSDVTSRRRLEDELRQAQKLEAVARLTGGVAHDFNNLLCVILSGTELALRTEADASTRDDLKNVREAGERAAALTRQLLAFSRKQVLQPRVLDIGDTVRGVEKLLRRLIGEDVRLVLELDEALAPVRVDAGQLEQVLMNLSVNARDAMPNGGTLTLSAVNATVGPGEVEGVPPGQYVCLQVEDTGCGIDAATRERMFEPFFTTKPASKGTGLGLTTCHGIVTQSGGFITVDSAPGQGAVFSVWLPRSAAAVAAAAGQGEAALRGGSETVLVVEDDEPLRRTLVRMLGRFGYTVVAARNGAEALERFEQNREAVKLVLCDVVMEGTNGPDTVRELLARDFHGRVLFMSGYADRPELQSALGLSHGALIQKPFQRDGLARVVRATLDAELRS